MALAEIKGGVESRNHIEVALVNEIIDRGRFEIVDRTTVQKALATYPTEADWQGLGQKIGADYILAFRVDSFDVNERQGYDKVEEEDSALAEELGTDEAVATRYVKVKSYQGNVTLQGRFFDVAFDRVSYEGKGMATEAIASNDLSTKKGARSEMPRKMQLLEGLSQKAVRDFFEQMPK